MRRRIIVSLAEWMVDRSSSRPRTVLVAWLLIVLPAVAGLVQLQIEPSGDSALDRADPAWAFYERSKELFGGDELLVVALSAPRPHDLETLEQVARITTAFEKIPGVRRADSVGTVPLIRLDESEALEIDALLERPPEERASPERVAALLAQDRIAPRSLISEDGRTLAVNLILEPSYTRGHERLLAEVDSVLGEIPARVSGVPTFRVATNRYTQSEILVFSPITALLLFALLWLICGRWTSALVALLPGVAGAQVALGAMGWSGAPLGITTLILPPVLIALGCAYALHVMLAAARREDASVREALLEVSAPVWLSGITTALGFAALTIARIDLVAQLGTFGTLGVLAVTAAALSILPAALSLRPGLVPRRRLRAGGATARIVRGLAANRRAVLLAWALLAVACATGLPRLRVDTDLTRWLPLGNPIRDDYEAIRTDLSGISPVNVVIEAPDGASVLEPAFLDGIDRLAAHLESLPGVGRALSVADPMRQIHGAFSGDSTQPLPQDSFLAEQYLLMLESVEQIDDVITDDHRAANILLRVDDNSSVHLLSLDRLARSWWKAETSQAAKVQATGLMFEYARAEEAIADGQLRGLAAAVGAISVVLLLTAAQPRRALLALLPNVAPLIVLFGVMGWLGIPVNVGTAIIATLALGIAVDDTVHLLSHYDEGCGRGLDPLGALRHALEISLVPLACTTVIISLAFGIFAFSEFGMTRTLGILTASIMFVCFAADFTLLGASLARDAGGASGTSTSATSGAGDHGEASSA